MVIATHPAINHLHELFVAEVTGIDLSVPIPRDGDAVMWDNRCTLHRATTYDQTRYKRKLHRTTIAGRKPDSAFAVMPEPLAAY